MPQAARIVPAPLAALPAVGQTMAVSRKKRAEQTAGAALHLSEPAQRLRAAQALRDNLLAKVARRKATLELVQREALAAVTKVAGHVSPRLDELRSLQQQIHELFASVARDRKRPAAERRAAQRAWDALVDNQVLPPPDLDTLGARGAQMGWGFGPADADDGPDFDGYASERDREVGSAPRPQDTKHGQLRAIYRRLVDAFHPDKVQDPQEKAACTEVMKDITSAYRHGDLARLLEIEQRWLSQQSGMDPGAAGHGEPASDEEATQRAVMVERGNDELRAQLAQLERELRTARRAPEARLARDLKQGARVGRDETHLEEVRALEDGLVHLRILRAFIASFAAREITLEQFLYGPTPPDEDDDGEDADADDYDYDEFLDAVTDLAQQLMEVERAQQARAAQRQRSAKAAKATKAAQAAKAPRPAPPPAQPGGPGKPGPRPPARGPARKPR